MTDRRPPLDRLPSHGAPIGTAIFAALVFLGALVVTGCATVPPEPPADPAGVEVPATWDALAEDASLGDALAADGAWWLAFDDPALARRVDRALEANPNLAAAAARLRAAEARARVAGADLAPQVSAGLDASRRRQNFIGLPIPGSEGRVLSNTNTTLGVSLDVSWELDLWGRLANSRDAAARDFAAARADLAGAALSISGQTAKAHFAAVEARRQLTLAEATLESQELSAERVRRRWEAGLRSPLDLRLARTEVARSQATVETRRRVLDSTERQLQVLLGRYPERPEGVLSVGASSGDDPHTGPNDDRAVSLPAPPALVPPGLPSELVARRPDLAALERRLEATGHRVAAARAALYPQIRLTGSVGRSSEELDDLLDNDFTVWGLVGSLLQPVFQGGRLQANADLAEATFDEAVATYAAEVLGAFAEVETALAADRILADEAAALARAVEEAEAALALAEDRYRSGLQDYLTVLESRRAAYQAESQLLDARRQRLDARVDLVLALGGGFEATLVTGDRPSSSEAPDREPSTVSIQP